MTALVVVLVSLGVVVVILVALIGTAAARLTTLRSGLDNAFARVDEELQRHHDAIRDALDKLPDAERTPVADALEAAERARETAAGSTRDDDSIAALRAAEDVLDAAIGASSGLREEIENSRDRKAFAAEAHDEAALAYEAIRLRPPGRFVAGLLGFPAAVPLAHGTTERSR